MERGALSLLSNYGGDSSEDEIPNGRVSVKRRNCDAEFPNKRLPVPELVIKHSVKDETPVDDAELHNGRQRSFPHERGNWVTYVYIPYEPANSSIHDCIIQIIDSLSYLSFQSMNEFHISLTKTLILKHHWIEMFIQSIKEKLSSIRKFVIVFDCLKVYCNEERTRTFLGIQIGSGYDSLIKIVEQLDSCLGEFRLPPFYKDPSFHMSVASCVGDHEQEVSKMLPRFNAGIQEYLVNHSQNNWYSYVTHLECKCGNKLFTFKLD